MKIRCILLTLSIFVPLALSAQNTTYNSGPEIGEECPPFDPIHVWGPDQGKKVCPMCKYGYQQGILVWLNTDNFSAIAPMLTALESEIERKGFRRLRVFVIYMNPAMQSAEVVEEQLKKFAKENGLKKIALTYIPDPNDPDSAGAYNINPNRDVENTIIVYRTRRAFEKHINFVPNNKSIQALIESVMKAGKLKS